MPAPCCQGYFWRRFAIEGIPGIALGLSFMQMALTGFYDFLDVWYNVQRKWMYLESIFIGADAVLKLNFLR